MGRSRSRSRSPRRDRERAGRRSRSKSRERDRRRERVDRPERPDRHVRERERERVDRGDRGDRLAGNRERRRSRSASPARWPRGRSPPGHGRSSSPPPLKGHMSKDHDERPEIDESQLKGKTEDEREMMKLMGFCNFDTTKSKAAEHKSKPISDSSSTKDLIGNVSKDSDLSELPEAEYETRTVQISGQYHQVDKQGDVNPTNSSLSTEAKLQIIQSRILRKQMKKEKKEKAKAKRERKGLSVSLHQCDESSIDSLDSEVQELPLTPSHNSQTLDNSEKELDVKLPKQTSEKEKIEISVENIPLPPSKANLPKAGLVLLPRVVTLQTTSKSQGHNLPQPFPERSPTFVTPNKESEMASGTPLSQKTPRGCSRTVHSEQTHQGYPGSAQSQKTPQNQTGTGLILKDRFSSTGSPKTAGGSSQRNRGPSMHSRLGPSPDTPVSRHTLSPSSFRKPSYCTKCFEQGHTEWACRSPKRCRVCRVLGHHAGNWWCEYYVEDPRIMPFQGGGDILSNFYPCTIQMRSQTFHSSEQAYQYIKAIDWHQPDVASRILMSPTALASKKSAKAIKGPSKNPEEAKVVVMKEVLEAKAAQVPEYRNLLIAKDSETIFAEATTDLFWAAGLAREESRHSSPHVWPGKNVLGKLHRELAEKLKAECKQEVEEKPCLSNEVQEEQEIVEHPRPHIPKTRNIETNHSLAENPVVSESEPRPSSAKSEEKEKTIKVKSKSESSEVKKSHKKKKTQKRKRSNSSSSDGKTHKGHLSGRSADDKATKKKSRRRSSSSSSTSSDDTSQETRSSRIDGKGRKKKSHKKRRSSRSSSSDDRSQETRSSRIDGKGRKKKSCKRRSSSSSSFSSDDRSRSIDNKHREKDHMRNRSSCSSSSSSDERSCSVGNKDEFKNPRKRKRSSSPGSSESDNKKHSKHHKDKGKEAGRRKWRSKNISGHDDRGQRIHIDRTNT